MGLQQFEQRLERLVEGAFAKAYRRGLQPVEIGRRLMREMDLHRTVGVHGLVAPNQLTVALAPDDFARFEPFSAALVKELEQAAREHARDEGYKFLGPVTVELQSDSLLRAGTFLVAGEVVAGPEVNQRAALILPSGRKVEMEEDTVAIGRLPGCTIVLDDPNVSRRHAEIRRQGGDAVLVDLGSTNGTLVNGVAVRRHRLEHGDRITLGNTTLVYEAG